MEIRQRNSILSKSHGNKACKNQTLREDVQEKLMEYLSNIVLQDGEAIAARKYKRSLEDGHISVTMENFETIVLPSHYTFKALHAHFLSKNPTNDGRKLLSRSSVVSYWQKEDWFSNLKIRCPSSDICDECCLLRNQLLQMTDEDFTMQIGDYHR